MSTPIPIAPAHGWTVFPRQDENALDPARLVIDPRFRAIKVLGRGGMGCVVLCEDRVLRSRAAVKILLAQDRDSRQRFREEATLLANIRHPHLVQVLTVGETEDGAPYMAMEHLGSSLAEKLADGEPLPWQEVVESAGQVAAALAALHRAGVVHRDVKPENIVALRGVTGRTFVKLIDLGVARIEDLAEIQSGGEPHPRRRRTEAGRALGTRGYWPPEAGLVSPSPSFDLYSLGVTIYRLCTGILPNPLKPRSMREARSDLDLPQALDALVERAMSVLPEDRPSSASSFGRELASILAAAANGRRPPVLFDDCYELFEVLGIGAKAEVYRAYHRERRRYAQGPP